MGFLRVEFLFVCVFLTHLPKRCFYKMSISKLPQYINKNVCVYDAL